MDAVEPYLPLLWDGMKVTILVTVIGVAVSIPFSLILGMGRVSRYRLVRALCRTVAEFLRGTSVIVQLFWVFYALPLVIEYKFDPMAAATVVLGLNCGAYAAEAVRSALGSLPQGQHDAAVALGLSQRRFTWRILLPQTFPRMLPPFGTAAIDLMKASSVVGFVTVQDLTFRSDQVRAATGESLAVYGVVLVSYFAFALVISGLFRGLERIVAARHDGRSTRRRRVIMSRIGTA